MKINEIEIPKMHMGRIKHKKANVKAVITYEYYQTEKVNWYAEKEL